ncbi:MAG: AraC family transcriptional regulator [Clostridiaceae bacterium]|nr:AraC family transcriptional regulator [Clostridiaceae bacterium]
MQQDLSIINRGFSDVNPLICGWQHCEPGHSYGPAARDYYLFHYVVSGKGSFYRGSVRTDLSAGSLFLIRPNELTFYQADRQDPWFYVWLGFDGTKCAELLEATDFADNRSTVLAPHLNRLFTEIQTDCRFWQHSLELFLCARLYEILAMLQRPQNELPVQNRYVLRAVDYIKANYAMSVSIGGIARLIGIDRRYLCRIFTMQTGLSPKNYLMDIRLKRAAYYLAEQGYSVQDAARSVGYQDVFNFSKAFKRHFGLPPSRYRAP